MTPPAGLISTDVPAAYRSSISISGNCRRSVMRSRCILSVSGMKRMARATVITMSSISISIGSLEPQSGEGDLRLKQPRVRKNDIKLNSTHFGVAAAKMRFPMVMAARLRADTFDLMCVGTISTATTKIGPTTKT